jgi:ribonucleoside-diphosphate reductase alpha subunit
MDYQMEHSYVVKRDGRKEKVHFDKITARIENLLSQEELLKVDVINIVQKTINSIKPGITTEELDLESAKICANLATKDYIYSLLAGRICVSNLHKKTSNKFSDKMIQINIDSAENGRLLLDEKFVDFVSKNSEYLDSIVDYTRDYNYDIFAFKTLERAYLIKNQKTGKIYERPQDMFLRVATFLNMNDLDNLKKTYDLMSLGNYTHASPTLFNGATTRSQLSSCFLIATEDSMDGITKNWSDVSQISKWGGGIGLHISNIRAYGSLIRGTNGPSSGIIPMLKVYNEIARYVNQGGKRKGSIAVYLEPHHSDITEFLELRKNFGAETERARDLFLALWIPDLFMKQVEEDGDWYLMCPDECPNLNDVYGEEYEKLYWKYVSEGKYRKKIAAKDLMKQIMDSQLETGTPYIAYKDHCNRKSNQNNLGTIKSSNLCIEIVEYSDKNETAVCNLASIAINSCLEPFEMKGKFVIYTKKDCKYCSWAKLYMKNKNWDFEEIEDEMGIVAKSRLNTDNKITMPQIWYELAKIGGGEEYVGGFEDLLVYTADKYNYDKLYDIAYTATRNLDSVIDLNYYPTIETKRSNMKHRPIGLGIQGLADALARMRIPFESEIAVEFNKRYMEYIYKASVQASSDMAKERYEDSKKLVEYLNKNNNIPEFYDENYRLDNEEMNNYYHKLRLNLHETRLTKQFGAYSSYESSLVAKGLLQFDLWENEPILDWGELRKQINKYGIRNSLLTALMPTASTSQILGNNECFEAMTSNIYTRRTLAGDFPLVNKYMMEDFKNIGVWSDNIKDVIIANNGSVSNLNIPNLLKDLYKTVWEIKQIWVLKQARARGPYVDQSQSMNIFMETPNYKKLYSSHLWGWKNGLKTGIYYLRSKPSATAIKFSLDAKYDNCESCSA